MTSSFEQLYPNLTYLVESFGWLALGQDDYSRSLIRILNEGGMIWEGEDQYESVDAALRAAEAAVAAWFKEVGVEDAP
jgi:hypothetical protein